MYLQEDDEDYKSYTTLSQIDCCIRWHYTKDKRHIEKLLERTKNIDYQIPAKGKFVLHNERLIGLTALHLTCYWHENENENEICESIQILLNYNADTTIKDAFGLTALLGLVVQCKGWMRTGSFACDCVSRLLSAQVESNKHENPCNQHGFSHFHTACMANHSASVQFFLKHSVDVNQTVGIDSPIFPGYSPLHFAVISGTLETVEILLEGGADPFLKNADGLTPVHQLIKHSIDLFNSIIDIHRESDGAAREVSLVDIEGNEQIMDLFLKNERIHELSVLDEFGLSVVHLACTLKSESSIEQLLMNNAVDVDQAVNANSPVCPGFTPLHFAAIFNPNIAMILLQKGADLSIKNRNGQSPLHIFLNEYPIEEIHAILSIQLLWKNILMSDGETKLLDIVHSMQDHAIFECIVDELRGRKQKEVFVPMDAPLWPGYTLLHLAVLFSERANAEFLERQSINGEKVNLKIIEKCLQWDPKAVNAQDARGSTPVHLGFILRKFRVVKMLIRYCGQENPANEDNLSHLHIACAASYRTAVESFMVNADINAPVSSNYTWFMYSKYYSEKELHSFQIKSGYTPLHISLANGNYQVAKILLKRGADINVTDDHGMTPNHWLFHQYLDEGLRVVTKILWSHPDLKDVVAKDTGLSHLHVAVTHKNVEAVERLLKLGADPNAVISNQLTDSPRLESYAGYTPLHLTKLSYTKDSKIFYLLLRYGADVSVVAKDFDLLKDMLWRIKSTPVSTSYLEEKEAAQSRIRELTGLTMLHIACYFRELESVKSILENDKADVNAQMHQDSPFRPGCTPLHLLMLRTEGSEGEKDVALGEQIVNACKLLLKNGANVALWSKEYATPMHAAMLHSRPPNDVSLALAACVNAMLDKYDDFSKNLVNEDGISLFHVACRVNAVRAAKKFLEHGVDVNEPIDKFLCCSIYSEYADFTPLHLCLTRQYSLRMVDLLLRFGANVHAENFKGDTPLHCAALCCRRRQTIFEKLIAAGADVNAENVYSETPLEVALRTRKATPREIKFFCERGYKQNYFNNTAQTGLMSCIFRNGTDWRLADAMLSAPGFCEPDQMGRTALHNIVACRKSSLTHYQYVILIEKFIKSGCIIDFRNKPGQTALHYAALFSNAKAVSALLSAGADINVVDHEANTPYVCALNPYEAMYDVDAFRNSSNCESTIKILANHVHQLQFLNLYVSKANAKIQRELIEYGYSEDSCLKDYLEFDLDHMFEPYSGCAKELKTFPIGKSSVKFSEFLTDAGVVFAYPTMTLEDRKAINKFFQDKRLSHLEYSFGKHVKFLNLQYQKALVRKTLLEQAKVSLVTITQFFLPELCAHATVKLLSNDDLKNIIASANEMYSY